MSEDRSEFTDLVRFLPPRGEGATIDIDAEDDKLFSSVLPVPVVPLKPTLPLLATATPEVDCWSLLLMLLDLEGGIGDPGDSNMD